MESIRGCLMSTTMMMTAMIVSSVSSEEILDSVVIKGGTAHLWCHFQAPNSSWFVPQRKMIYSKFRPAIAQDVPIWAGPQVPSNDSNRRLRMRYILNDLSVNITRVHYNDAGTYSCVDEDNRIILSHNLIVTGGTISLEKSFESYDKEDGQYYLVPGGARVFLICSLDLSSTPWDDQYPSLSLDGVAFSSRRRYGNTLSYTFVTYASKSKEFTCNARFPGSDWSPLRPAKVTIVIDDTQSQADYQRHVIKYAANQGEPLVLSCVSAFDSNDNWKWYKNVDLDSQDIAIPIVDCHMIQEGRCENLTTSVQLEDYSTRLYSLLVFPALDYASSGKYSCIDSLSTVQKSFEIIVLDNTPPEVKVDGRPVDNNSILEFRKNQWVYISCGLKFFISSGIDSRLKLVVTEATLYNTSRDGLTYIYRVLMLRSRSYECHVELSTGFQFYGERANFTFFANAFYCPDSLKITGNLTRNSIQRGGILNCIASAEPPVNVTWEARTTIINHFITGPNFASLMVQDIGDYRCRTERASHTILGICSMQYATIRIDQVQSIPRSRVVKIGALRGKSFTIKCSSHHLRNTNWKWFRNWKQPPLSFNLPIVDCVLHEAVECSNVSTFYPVSDYSTASLSQLVFHRATMTHAGNYTCVDSLRSVEKTYEIQVLECPGVMTVSKLNWERPYGQGKELMCSVTAEPPMNVTWSFRNQSRVSISGWNSARMPVFQSGIYECTVDVDHQGVLGSCGSLFSRVQVEDNHDDEHHVIEDRR